MEIILISFQHAPGHSLVCAIMFVSVIVASACMVVGAIQIDRARSAPARMLAARRRRIGR
ncbi:MAG: hypothetical protein IPK81_14055 [Rhodospirillales bacterium]|nr:MAG: hypothetical protein IPK81_14055 [Rhodospirillales bacterium]